MKTKLILCIALLLPSISFAEEWNWGQWPWSKSVAVAPGLVTNGANPDRTTVSGSAILMNTDGQIKDDTIPTVPEVIDEVPENKITDVVTDTNAIEPAAVETPKVDPQLIVDPTEKTVPAPVVEEPTK